MRRKETSKRTAVINVWVIRKVPFSFLDPPFCVRRTIPCRFNFYVTHRKKKMFCKACLRLWNLWRVIIIFFFWNLIPAGVFYGSLWNLSRSRGETAKEFLYLYFSVRGGMGPLLYICGEFLFFKTYTHFVFVPAVISDLLKWKVDFFVWDQAN